MSASIFYRALVTAVVLSAVLPPSHTSVAAGAPPCECHHGIVQTPTPRCYCACTGDYLMPYCRYTTTQIVAVEVWFVHDPNMLNSDLVTAALQAGINNGENVTFIFAWKSFNNKTMMRYTMSGSSVFHLKKDVSDNLPWIVDLGIDATYEAFLSSETPVVARPEEYVLFTRDNMVFTLDSMAWLFGAIGTLLFMLMLDQCCGGSANDAELIKRDIQMGIWNPKPKLSKEELAEKKEEREKDGEANDKYKKKDNTGSKPAKAAH
jgi:hypothetical protein